ncbi:hypothetical protein BAE44_0020603 [Dichanthelium oligosanthes]|uniref:Uncharacterized protein n=1 Tax=Dichanthelium oligosanthes TaxID=888268 RepID=A0A1E5UZW5_9POAL|nr:hypothetical protein BAE44_0020603 [Dichanthelium oligosanthes]
MFDGKFSILVRTSRQNCPMPVYTYSSERMLWILALAAVWLISNKGQVNNAGISCPKPAVEVMAAEYSLVMATNLESGFHWRTLSSRPPAEAASSASPP